MIYLATKYALFAAIATAVNIGTQWLFLRIYTGSINIPSLSITAEKMSLLLAMACGTITGLIVKYILDKKYIFYHKVESKQDDFKKFTIYSFMGGFTTLIFWGSELIFDYLFAFKEAKFIGAVVGLTIGYITKYQLDKKFVFIENQKTKSSAS